MKQVQDALSTLGIPVMAGIWRATSPAQNPPTQYVVYSTTTTEGCHVIIMVRSLRSCRGIHHILGRRILRRRCRPPDTGHNGNAQRAERILNLFHPLMPSAMEAFRPR